MGQGSTVQKQVAAERLGPQEREVGLGEAEDTPNYDLLMAAEVERGADCGDLALEPVDQPAAGPAADEQVRSSEPGGPDLDLALSVFGVDDPHAGRRDGEVVDIPVTAGHAAVMQRDDPAGLGASRQRLSDRLFGKRSLEKGGFMLRGVAEGEKQAAQARVRSPRASVAVAFATLMLALQARPRISNLHGHLRRQRRSVRVTPTPRAGHGARVGVPPRRRPRGEIRGTAHASVASTELESASGHTSQDREQER